MVQVVFRSAFEALRRGRLLLPIAGLLAVTNALNWWGTGHKTNPLVPLLLLILSMARVWANLGVQNVALGIVRKEADADVAFRAWVPPGVVLQLLLAGLVVGVAILTGAFVARAALSAGPLGAPVIAAVVVAAAYLAIVLSQYAMLILDGRAEMAEAFMLSVDLTKGHRVELFGLFAAVMSAFAATFCLFWLGGVNLTAPSAAAIVILTPISIVFAVVLSFLNAAVYVYLLADHERRLAAELTVS